MKTAGENIQERVRRPVYGQLYKLILGHASIPVWHVGLGKVFAPIYSEIDMQGYGPVRRQTDSEVV